MKKLLLLFALVCAPAFAANIQIENIPTTVVLPGSDDYGVMSGATRGTNKILMNRYTMLTATRTTLAALSITGASDGTGILVLGASAAGDGGGASYFWSASSSATPNGDTVIQPASMPATGRWLKAVGGVGTPGISTLGGVFSNAGATHQFISAINTDGTVTLAQPSAADILGLGSMALQNSSGVAVTGGTINGTTIGASAPTSGAFTTLTAAGAVTATVTTGTGYTVSDGTVTGVIRPITGPALAIGTTSAHSWSVWVNSAAIGQFTPTGMNALAVGQTTPAAGAFTTLGATGEFKGSYGIFTAPIAAYNSSSGGIYLGYGAGTGILRSVADNSGNVSPFQIQIGNGTQSALFLANGMQGDIGLTTPGHADFIDIAWLNNAGIRTTKANAHLLINVKDYGAAGDGGTNDTTAINAAIAAMTNWSTLYFPAGSYLVTPGSITGLSSLNHISIIGDGYSSQLVSTATGAPGNFLVITSSCDHVTLRDFSIIGAATARGSGIGIRMYASYSRVSNIFIQGTSDFGMLITNDAGGYTREVQVEDCLSSQTLGDGFHFGYVTDSSITNCQAYYTSDDGLGIGDDGATGFPPTRIEVINFQSIQAGNHAGGGTHGSGIRIFDGAVDIHITGGSIYQSCEAGIQTTRATSTTAYSTRIQIDGVKIVACLQQAGMYANVSFAFANSSSIKNCWSEAPVSQGCFAFLDCNDLTVIGNTAKDAVVRAFVTDDGTTTNVASSWSNWTFLGNVCLGSPSNESYYFVPATGKVITNLLVTGNTETGQSAGNYIFTNRLAGVAKINNNTSLGGKAVANGGSGVAPTVANNN